MKHFCAADTIGLYGKSAECIFVPVYVDYSGKLNAYRSVVMELLVRIPSLRILHDICQKGLLQNR